MATVCKADLAKQLNVTTAAVDVWIKRGLRADARGQFEREQALEWVASNIEPQVSRSGISRGSIRAGELLNKGTRRKRGDGGNGNGADLLNPAQERAKRDAALTARLERQNLVAEGKLVTIEDAVREHAQGCAVIRNKLLGLAAKIAPRAHAAAADGTQAVCRIIHAEVVEVLHELSRSEPKDDAA